MELSEIKAWILEHAEQDDVKNYIEGFITDDRVKAYLETESGAKILQPKLDQYFAKGLATWKDNNLEKLVNEKLLEANPEESEQDKRIKALELSLARAEKERIKQEIKNKTLKKLTDKKYPVELVDFINAENDEELDGQLQNLTTSLDGWVKGKIEEKFKENGRIPNKPDPKDGDKNPWSKKDFNLTEQGRITRENPDLAKYYRENTRS